MYSPIQNPNPIQIRNIKVTYVQGFFFPPSFLKYILLVEKSCSNELIVREKKKVLYNVKSSSESSQIKFL